MRKTLLLLAMLLFAAMVFAQTSTHSVVLTWIAPNDATSSGDIQVYRGIGDCSTNPVMTAIGTPVAATITTYTDPIGPGTYCYYVIHTENKTDSVASNTAAAVLRPNAASGLTAIVK